LELTPFLARQNPKCDRIDLTSWGADTVGVVLDDEQHRQLFFSRETDCFKKITLARSGVSDRCDDEIFFAVEFQPPSNSAGGKELRPGRSRHAPNVQFGITVMRRHHPTAAAGFAFGEI